MPEFDPATTQPEQGDWFKANAPKASGDWFAQNAPSQIAPPPAKPPLPAGLGGPPSPSAADQFHNGIPMRAIPEYQPPGPMVQTLPAGNVNPVVRGGPTMPAPAANGVPQILAEEPQAKPLGPIMLGQPARTTGIQAPESQEDTLKNFLLSPPKPIQDLVKEFDQIMVGPFQIHQKALIEPLADMTSPAGVGLAAVSGGLAAAGASTSASVAQAGKAANAALSAYFATESGLNVLREVPAAARDVAAGRYEDALGKLGSAGTSAFLGYLAGRHAAGELSDIQTIGAVRKALQSRLNFEERGRSATERRDARQAREAIPKLGTGQDWFTENAPVEKMSDVELKQEFDRLHRDKPKNARERQEQIGFEVQRRLTAPPPAPPVEPASGVVPPVQAEPLTPEVVHAAPAEPPVPPQSAGIPAVPSAEQSIPPQVQPPISPAARAQEAIEQPATSRQEVIREPKAEAVPEAAGALVVPEGFQPATTETKAPITETKVGVSETKEATSEVKAPSPETKPEPRTAGWVGNIPTAEIHVDAPRFQFKANVGQGGAGEELRGIEKWDPEKAGILAVWRDPADGKTYVVNGHHRVDLATRTNAPEMTVRYLDAKDAKEARLKGALINIAEGRGESTDAARIFRDSNLTPDDLQKEGVSLKGKIASEGMALSQLAQPIFDDVISGDLSPARGAVIGQSVPAHADQRALYDILKQSEKSGKRLTNDQLSELIQLAQGAPKQTETHEDLFGEETVTRSLLREKAEVSDYIRKQLAADRKLFGAVATQGAAERLKETGNVIKAGENAQVAESANQGLTLYDKLKSGAGTINTALDRAAQSLADGENANEVKQRAYRQIKSEVAEQVRRLTGTPAGNGAGAEVLGREGPREAGRGEHAGEEQPDIEGHRPGERHALSDAEQASLVSSDAEAESRATAQSEKDKLLGKQLTAQIASGAPARPTKLKPIQNRGLFEEEGPEQGGLFGSVDVAGSRPIPGFYSQLGRTIEAKMPDKASPQQVLGILRNPQNGVKADEIKWTGIDDFLSQHKGAVTKQEVLDFLKTNEITVEEKELGGPRPGGERLDSYREWRDQNYVRGAGGWEDKQTGSLFTDERLREMYDEELGGGPTKFSNYVTPGGENYRELLLTLPPKPQRVTWEQTEPDTWKSTSGDTITGEHGRFEIYDFTKRNKGFKLYDSVYRHTLDFPSLEEAQAAAERGRTSELTQGDQYKSPHWDEPNVLAHVRMDDRTGPRGEKILHVEEIQSDWHQSGKRKGYKGNDDIATLEKEAKPYMDQFFGRGKGDMSDAEWKALGDKVEDYQRRIATAQSGVPNAPFSKTWPELAFRRILRYAAENDYDTVTWTTGAQQAERYSLSNQVEYLAYVKHPDGQIAVLAGPKTGEGEINLGTMTPDKLADTVGKEMAQKIIDSKERKGILEGLDLKVGGEGMKGFYDQILPAYANKYAKKWGARGGEGKLHVPPELGKETRRYHGPELSSEAFDEWLKDRRERWKNRTAEGHASWNVTRDGQAKDIKRAMELGDSFKEAMENHASPDIAHELGGAIEVIRPTKPLAVHSISITPAMRESVMQGQPLFFKPPVIPQLPDNIRTAGFQRNAPTVRHVESAAITPLKLEGPVAGIADAFVTNPSGMELLGRAAGQPADYIGSGNVGLHFSPKDVGTLARNLNTILQRVSPGADPIPDGAKSLLGAMQEAAKNGKSVVLLSDHPDWEPFHQAALAEELRHAIQSAVTGHTRTHFGGSLDSFIKHPAFEQAANPIRARYTQENPRQVALEVSVRLMYPEGVKDLESDPQDLRSLAAQYVRGLKKEHGSANTRNVAREVFDTLRPNRRPDRRGAGQSGESAGGIRRGGGSWAPEGPGPDISGNRPPRDSQIDEREPRRAGRQETAEPAVPGAKDLARSEEGGSRFIEAAKETSKKAIAASRVIARRLNEFDALLTGREIDPSEEPPQTYATLEDFMAAHGPKAKQSEPTRTDANLSEPQEKTESSKVEPGSKERKTSKLALGVQEKAIAEKLTEGFEGLPEYDVMNVAEQAKLAAQFLADEPARAVRVAMGHGYPPEGVRQESVFIAVENKAIADGDAELMRRLATESSLPSASTKMGQAIRMLGERVKNSPVALIQKVADARQKAATKRFGNTDKIKVRIKLEVRDDINRANKKKDAWISFIDELRCR